MKEAIELVEACNVDFYEQTGNDEFIPFKLETNGMEYTVMFLDFPIFNSGNDSLDEGQTLAQFVNKGIVDIVNDIKKMV